MKEIKENRFLIREVDEKKDIKMIRKLEKKCEIGSRKGVSILTNIMTHPLSRIRFFPLHVMVVAERLENKEIVGVVRGCIKFVGTGNMGAYVKLGCILGLRVAPEYRRKGIGLRLVKSIEEWLMRNGAEYSFLAAEKNNVASSNLFSLKCNYLKFSTLVIYAQPVPVSLAANNLHKDIKIEKIHMEQAISLYNDRLKFKGLYASDIHSILNENQSLGTWVAYFKDEKWIGLESKEKQPGTNMLGKTPKSWAMFSVWSSCELCKLPKTKNFCCVKFLRETLGHATKSVLSCSRMLVCDSGDKPFGFLFLFGLHGEGVRLEALMKSIWIFASKMAENSQNCKLIITELGVSDPLREYIPGDLSMSCIDDLWYVKKLDSIACNQVNLAAVETICNVFVDPRDF